MKRLFLFITISVLLSCNDSSKPKVPDIPEGEVTILAVHTLTDSSRLLEWSPRIITETIVKDSVTKKKSIVVDTLWFITRMIPKQVNGKDVLDSLGKPVLEKRYFARPKDSVRYNISNIPMDSLLSKKAPTH